MSTDPPNPVDRLSELALSEAIRALDEQQAALASARSLAGLLVGTIGIVAGTLATAVFRNLGTWHAAVPAIVGAGNLTGAGLLVVIALFPIKWSWSTDARKILGWQAANPTRQLAEHLADYATEHEPKLVRIWEALRDTIILTGIAVTLLLFALVIE